MRTTVEITDAQHRALSTVARSRGDEPNGVLVARGGHEMPEAAGVDTAPRV